MYESRDVYNQLQIQKILLKILKQISDASLLEIIKTLLSQQNKTTFFFSHLVAHLNISLVL